MRGVTSNTSWAQAFSQGRIIEVALGLIEVANRVALRHGAVAQAGNLRENEPHPVGPLVRRGSVLRRPGRTGSLRLHEANEIRIGHEGSVRHALISAPQDGENLRLPGRFVLLRSRKRADGSRHLV